MLIKNIVCLVLGIIFGSSISSGLFALINSIKIIPRYADKTHTKQYVTLYETAILVGATFWNIVFLFDILSSKLYPYPLNHIFLGITGILIGIFVGSLAVSLAERLSVSAIISRRFKIHHGFNFTLLAISLGYLVGNLMYFFYGWSS